MAKETEPGLRKMQFTKTLRGYACEEVDTYFAHVNDRYVALMRECSELKKKMAVVAASQNEFREEALREKEKIAAEADALLAEKKAAANALISEAEQKAAMILSRAETAAAGILRQAEAEAEEVRQKNAAQLEMCKDTERKIRSHNNTADRLVAEIDSFREKIFAMYASHIEALEQLSQLTDDFYKAKEELTIDTVFAPTEPVSEPIPEEDVTPVEEPIEEPSEEPSEEPIKDSDEDSGEELVRIDWQEHRQKHAEKMAGKTLWEIVDEAEAQAAENKSDAPTEEALDRLFQPAQPEEATDEDLWEEPVFAPEAADEPLVEETVPEPLPDEPVPSAEEEEEDDLLAGLERDLLSAYAKDGVDGAEEAVDAFDLESLIGEDEPPVQDTEDSEEDFLADIASEYLKPAPATDADTDENDERPDITATDADNLDDLLDDEQSHDVSLTGEFDKIFSSKKSAAYVDEVNRQPLVEATKPEKPKKHK